MTFPSWSQVRDHAAWHDSGDNKHLENLFARTLLAWHMRKPKVLVGENDNVFASEFFTDQFGGINCATCFSRGWYSHRQAIR
jgi:hypothetical protein